MFSKLSKGYGSWNAGYVDPYFGEKRHRSHTLPEIEHESHCHGITVGPHSGRNTAMSLVHHKPSREPTSDSLPLPKTYTTRRGALQIYVAPEDEESEDEEEGLELKPKYVQIKRPSGQELINLSLKLGTMDRLAMSVLQFGDQEYDHDHTSISDAKNKAFLKFLHSIDNVGSQPQTHHPKTETQTHPPQTPTPTMDNGMQPGGDLNTYLRELRSSSSMRYFSDGSTYIPKSRESMELQAILRGLDNSWPLSFQQDTMSERQTPGQFTRPVSRVSSRGPSPGPPSTPRSTYQVLSTKKLAASIKSGSYLGRPSSNFSVADDDCESEMSLPAQLTSANVPQRQWSPSESQDDNLLQLRDQFYRGTEEDGEIDDIKKRRRFNEKSLLPGSELLYQGRNTYIVDGSHVSDMKGTSRGDGNSDCKSHGMLEIVEEMGEGKISGNADISEESDEADSVAWAENVASVQRINSEAENEIKVSTRPKIHVEEVTEKTERMSSARSRSRPGSNTSISSQSSKCTPTIISIQVSDPSKVPVNKTPEKPFVGLKRRKSLQNVISAPEKSRYIHPGYRQKSPKQREQQQREQQQREQQLIEQQLIEQQHREQQQREQQQREQINDTQVTEARHDKNMYRNPDRNYTFGPGVMTWSIGDDTAMQDRVNIPPDNTPDLSHEQVTLGANTAETAESRPDSGHSDAQSLNGINKDNDNLDQEEFLKEEDILDNLQKCNEEVEQIEAKGEPADDSSDSGTYVDEEDMIQVIREVEKEQGIEHNAASRLSRVSGLTADDVQDVKGEGTEGSDIASVDVVEGEENGEGTVDEVYDETQSSIRSRRSSRLSKIRKTKGESDDGSQEESDEPVLPNLLSDQLNFKVEQVSDETSSFIVEVLPSDDGAPSAHDIAPPTTDALPPVEQQTDIVGTADSYSDKLDSASNSKSVSRRVSSNAESISAEELLKAGDNEDSHESQNEVTTPSRNVDEPDSLSTEEVKGVSRPPSANLGSQVPEASIVADDTQINTELKVVIQINANDSVEEIAGVNDSSKDAPNIIKEDKGESESKIEKNDEVKTDVQTAGKGSKKERKPAGLVVRAGKSATKSNQQSKTDTVEEVTGAFDETDEAEVKQSEHKDRETQEAHVGKDTDVVDQASNLEQNGEGVEQDTETAEVPLQISSAKDVHSIASELDALGLRQPTQTSKKKTKKEKGSKYVPPPPPSKRVEAPKEEAKLPDHLQDLLSRQPTASVEYLEKDLERRGFLKDRKVTNLVDESLSGPTLEAVGEGLTEEELELAKQILQKKLDEAKGKIDGKETKAQAGKKKAAAKGAKKGGKKKKSAEEVKTEEEIQRDMIRHKHDQEKQNRDKEAAELQRKIQERKKMLSMQENAAEEKQKEIREKMEALEREADDLQRAEDEARDILAEVRRKQREEREARRKADLERKRNEASERRERERKEMEDKRKKESEMLEKIADAEMRRRLREEEERKAYEAERLAQEKYEEEMREAQRIEEEEEERLKEMERQAEEEAMQRLIDEREAAERQRRRLFEEEEALKEAEKKKYEIMMEEEKKLEDARLQMEAEENAKREAEKQRLLELRRLEEEARFKMQEEIEKRRSEAMARRDYNLDNKLHVDKLRHGQGITRAWTFSYFVQWPRETYESHSRKTIKGRRPIGGPDPRKAVIKNPPPRAKVNPPPETAGQPIPEAT